MSYIDEEAEEEDEFEDGYLKGNRSFNAHLEGLQGHLLSCGNCGGEESEQV